MEAAESRWPRDQRVARAVPEEKYRHGLCAAGKDKVGTEIQIGIRGNRGAGANRAAAVL